MRVRIAASLLAVGGSLALFNVAQASQVTAAPVRCATPAPTTAAGYQAMFDAKNDRGWSGGDQAASIALPDGRTLWMFGDTVRGAQTAAGPYAAGAGMVHNSFLLQDRGCLSAVRGPRGAEVVPNAVNGDWYWPQSALLERGRLVVVVARTRRTGNGSLDFRTVGEDAAVFSLAGGHPSFERIAPLPSSGAADDAAEYGAAVVPDGSWTYVYGTILVRAPLVFGRSVTVARVPAGSFLDRSAWRYWDGRTWARDRHAAAVVARGWSSTFSVTMRPDGTFRFLTKADDFLGRDVVTGTASSAVTPRVPTVLAAYPSGQVPGEVLYNPLAHPEARLAGGALLVSICRNNTDLSKVLAQGDLYKPQFFATAP